MGQGSKHPRPFQWSADRAAKTIAERLECAPRVVAFPWPLDLLTRLARVLPYPLYAALVRTTASPG